MVNQVGGRFHHASRRAGRAKSTAFATEGHQMLVTALGTLHAQKSVFEPPATQIRLEFLAHEAGQRCTTPHQDGRRIPRHAARQSARAAILPDGGAHSCVALRRWCRSAAGPGKVGLRCPDAHWTAVSVPNAPTRMVHAGSRASPRPLPARSLSFQSWIRCGVRKELPIPRSR